MSSDRPAPYGPNTPLIRRFLVRLAALGPVERRDVVERFRNLEPGPRWQRAESELARVIENSGRADVHRALSGPLLQLVSAGLPRNEGELSVDELDPIAEPALAALLSLVCMDLLSNDHASLLYEPFSAAVPRATLEPIN